MSNKVKFILSFLLILVLTVSMLCVPAYSYANDVETSTADMLLINLDTETTVFSQKPDNMWYAGYLSELMTFYIAYRNMPEPENYTYAVEQEFVDALPFSDGCLDQFVGETLTGKDLMAIMLLTTGNDAAYALADLVSDGDIDDFISQMREETRNLGCTKTYFSSPGYNESTDHVTCCSDLYRIFKAVYAIDLYSELSRMRSYTPEGLSEEDHTVYPEASIVNEESPYYFRYANDAKYSYSDLTFAGMVMTTTYREKTYFFAGLLGLNESERNIFADGRKLTTWAYLNLVDRKVIDSDVVVSETEVNAGWGSYKIPLYAKSSAYKTLPSSFNSELLSYNIDIPKNLTLPVISGQSLGNSLVIYDNEQIDDINLVSDHDYGISLLSDFARFGEYAIDQVLINEPPTEADEAAELTEGE